MKNVYAITMKGKFYPVKGEVTVVDNPDCMLIDIDGTFEACRLYKEEGFTEALDDEQIALVRRGWTRAKAFRYWGRYFPDRAFYELPEGLKQALDLPCRAWGMYYDKKACGACGFEG